MDKEKHYPTHPGAEHPPIMTCEIPLEEYESLKRENERLKRALYKACFNWAKSERYTEATWHGDEHREELWANVQTKCLAKVAQYK